MNVTACLGTRYCKFGIIDSVGLAEEIDKKFFGKELPVKVRIAISSCPNGCESERLNEIGITGIQRPIRDPGLCTGCGTCTHYCREKAISVQDGIVVLQQDMCMECGFCIKPCPFHLIRGTDPEYRITVGGHRGRHPKIGRHLIDVKTHEDVIRVVDKIIYWIYRQASSGSLLPEQLDELEFDEFKKTIFRMVEGYTGAGPAPVRSPGLNPVIRTSRLFSRSLVNGCCEPVMDWFRRPAHVREAMGGRV